MSLVGEETPRTLYVNIREHLSMCAVIYDSQVTARLLSPGTEHSLRSCVVQHFPHKQCLWLSKSLTGTEYCVLYNLKSAFS